MELSASIMHGSQSLRALGVATMRLGLDAEMP